MKSELVEEETSKYGWEKSTSPGITVSDGEAVAPQSAALDSEVSGVNDNEGASRVVDRRSNSPPGPRESSRPA